MSKLQYLLIKNLLNRGSVELLLPNGIVVEIGITQEDESGRKVKTEDYCYVLATKDKKAMLLDSYNLGIRFEEERDTILYDESNVDDEGAVIRSFEVV